MFLGRVIGRVVPAVVYEGLEGVPLLWIQPLDRRRQPDGRPFVCADGTRMAGPDELIYWEASREAALTLDPWFVPVDHAVVGIVDDVMLDEEAPGDKAPGDKARDDAAPPSGPTRPAHTSRGRRGGQPRGKGRS